MCWSFPSVLRRERAPRVTLAHLTCVQSCDGVGSAREHGSLGHCFTLRFSHMRLHVPGEPPAPDLHLHAALPGSLPPPPGVSCAGTRCFREPFARPRAGFARARALLWACVVDPYAQSTFPDYRKHVQQLLCWYAGLWRCVFDDVSQAVLLQNRVRVCFGRLARLVDLRAVRRLASGHGLDTCVSAVSVAYGTVVRNITCNAHRAALPRT